MNRRGVVAGLGLAAFSVTDLHAALLVTEEEARASREAREASSNFSLADASAPTIRLVAPHEASTVSSPLTIQIAFVPGSTGAAINPASFRAYYGALGIDITSRILPRAKVDAAGLTAQGAELPAGSHRVRLAIADTAGNQGQHTFAFTVA
ncbi:MAG: hypothetical protein WCH83_07795 [Alphaproteobacteria bacterium]